MIVNVMGVKIDNISKLELDTKITSLLADDKQHYIVTVNSEMLVRAQTNLTFLKVINRADLSLMDGVGVNFTSLIIDFQKLKYRIPGVDLMMHFCKIAERNNLKVYLLGGEKDIAKKALQMMLYRFPLLKGAYKDGSDANDHMRIIDDVNMQEADMLFVAYGSPKQELWITNNLARMRSVKIAVGVGGSFDYISGTIIRAPKILRQLGLEWLFRLIRQPWRIVRVFKATFGLIYYIILYKFNFR